MMQFSKFFFNYSAACSEGFFSRSQWKRRGRIVLEDAVPSVVVRKVARSHGRPFTYPVIEEVEPDVFLFAEECFLVYSIAQTLPKAVSPCIPTNSNVNTCILHRGAEVLRVAAKPLKLSCGVGATPHYAERSVA